MRGRSVGKDPKEKESEGKEEHRKEEEENSRRTDVMGAVARLATLQLRRASG